MGLHEILNRRGEIRTEPTKPFANSGQTRHLGSAQPATEPPPTSPAPADSAGFSLAAPLLPPPILRNLPAVWGLEMQRIAHYLKEGRERIPHVLVFSALTPKSGVTVMSYLVAHHLASTSDNQRILYADYRSGEPLPGVHGVLEVGAPFDLAQLTRQPALTVLSLRGGSSLSVAEKMRWFQHFTQAARLHFQQVIIDAPPFPRAVECYLLSSVSDGVVLIVRSGEVRRLAVNDMANKLEHMGIPVIGAILNFHRYPVPSWLLKYL